MLSKKVRKCLVSALSLVLTLAILLVISACSTPSKTDQDKTTPANNTAPVSAAPNTATAAPVIIDEPTEGVTDVPATPEVTEEPVVTPDPAQTKAAYDVYKAAVERRNALDDLSTIEVVTQDLSIIILGQKVNSKSVRSSTAQIAGIHSQTPIAHMYSVNESTGDSGNSRSEVDYYAGSSKIFYKSSDAADFTVLDRNDPSAESYVAILDEDKLAGIILPEEAFLGATIKEESDGRKTVTAVLDSSAMDVVFGGIADQMEAAYAAMGASDVSVKANGLSAKYVVSPEGFLLVSEMEGELFISFKIYDANATGTSLMKMSVEFVDPGSPVTITFPDGTTSNDQGDVYEINSIFNAAAEKTAALNDVNAKQHGVYEIVVDFGSGVIMQGEKMLDIEIKCKDYGSDKATLYMKQTEKNTGSEGTEQYTEEIFADDSNVYYIENGDIEEMAKQSRSVLGDDFVNETVYDNCVLLYLRTDDIINAANYVKKQDGSVEITMDQEYNFMKETVDIFISSFESTFTEAGYEMKSYTVKDSSMSFIISADGYVVSILFIVDADFQTQIDGLDTTITVNNTLTVELIDPGKPVSIEFPAQ